MSAFRAVFCSPYLPYLLLASSRFSENTDLSLLLGKTMDTHRSERSSARLRYLYRGRARGPGRKRHVRRRSVSRHYPDCRAASSCSRIRRGTGAASPAYSAGLLRAKLGRGSRCRWRRSACIPNPGDYPPFTTGGQQWECPYCSTRPNAVHGVLATAVAFYQLV